jgi:hypothetical protein
MSKKSAAVGTGAMLLSDFVAIVGIKARDWRSQNFEALFGHSQLQAK